nr:MAG TPA: hypothetical protein [Caudoviricetes sp.]
MLKYVKFGDNISQKLINLINFQYRFHIEQKSLKINTLLNVI